ncbi:MAG: peroxide stress protein YaaA [Eubacteriales bacterium]
MRIIVSPAKKMKMNSDTLPHLQTPVLREQSNRIQKVLQSMNLGELQQLWKCSDSIARLNWERLTEDGERVPCTPALLAYEGIQYQYMAPTIFEEGMLSYVEEHLRILSAFYGVLKPMDGIISYRLEMQAKLSVEGSKNLYDYWGGQLYQEVHDQSGIILNLASKEYARCIEPYLQKSDQYITCVFGEEQNGKVVQKGTYAKMARGEMVRYMAEHTIVNIEDIKKFNRLEYSYSEGFSCEKEYVYIRNK